LIYKLPLTIGNTTFESEFRLVERNDLLFDIIICYETIIENYLFINPVTFELCKINSNLESNELKNLFKEVKEKYKLWDVIEKLEELDRSDERKELKQGEIVNLLLYTEQSNSSVSEDESKQINFKEVNEVKIFNYHKDEDLKIGRREVILDGICGKAIGICNKRIIKKIRELLKMYDDVLALSSDDLGKSKLLPHSIQLRKIVNQLNNALIDYPKQRLIY